MTISNVQSVVASVAETVSGLMDQHDRDLSRAFKPMIEAGLTPFCIEAKGEHYAAFKMATLLAWQGAEFAEEFVRTKDAASLTGQVMSNDTQRKRKVELPKREWAKRLTQRITRARESFADVYFTEIAALRKAAEEQMPIEEAREQVAAERDAKAAEKAKPANKRGPIEVMHENITKIEKRLQAIREGNATGPDAKVLGDVTEAHKAAKLLVSELAKLK